MWTRRELKDRAKNVLRWNYWKAFLISLVILVAGGGGAAGGGGGSGRGGNDNSYSPVYDIPIEQIIAVILIILVAAAVFILIAVALRTFIGFPLEVGGRKYFVQSAQNFDNRGCFRFAFDGQNYFGIVAAMFLRGLQNFLWYLLFIIPGIVKSYSYSMVPYILADNPRIGASNAIRLSNNMTYGHKFDMFVLDLSFIGWYLLGTLAFGIGVLFVMPYANATQAELYLVLRRNALEKGMCRPEDLMLQSAE
jgi:uncharacterized membrane protein